MTVFLEVFHNFDSTRKTSSWIFQLRHISVSFLHFEQVFFQAEMMIFLNVEQEK